MKTFRLIYREGEALLRVKNPLGETQHLVSREAYEAHEGYYEQDAVRFLNPVAGKREYVADDLEMLWRFSTDGGVNWEYITEPNFIDTNPDMYQQVFKLKSAAVPPPSYQVKVQDWVTDCFGEEVATDKTERAIRFLEEALELAQASGIDRDTVHRCVSYTFGRLSGEAAKEAGDVMVTLASLCAASGIDMQERAEAQINENIKNSPAIREKWLGKTVVSV